MGASEVVALSDGQSITLTTVRLHGTVRAMVALYDSARRAEAANEELPDLEAEVIVLMATAWTVRDPLTDELLPLTVDGVNKASQPIVAEAYEAAFAQWLKGRADAAGDIPPA
jgi:hypothetical protein